MDTKLIQEKIANFAEERDWDQFHNPKNLAMALSVECSELVEIFQWMTAEQSSSVMKDESKASSVADELADIAVYLLRISDKLNVNLESAILQKIEKNKEKYPAGEFRGSARKYNDKG